ncbi:MAG: hypothetical protein EXX96DRAFT_590174 [Benjaminiella poitrasii]|nr:MAG: hypothetical protein EXX96DRAFT_590174 [Benjaminiella poitrasii]
MKIKMNIHSLCLKAYDNLYKEDINGYVQQLSENHFQSPSVQFTLSCHDDSLIVLFTGNPKAILDTRGTLLRNNLTKSSLIISSPSWDAIFHADLKHSLGQIAKEYAVQIQVRLKDAPEIHISGSIESVETTRVKVLVLLDTLAGLVSDSLKDIPHHFHPLVAGRKHAVLQSIMEETTTNIYLQNPFICLCSPERKVDTIYLTGETQASLDKAKELLKKVFLQKTKSINHKSFTVNVNKLDLIMLNKRNELRKIMKDNGSFISLSPLGSGKNSVTVYAENRIYTERSIRLFNRLACDIYEATFILKKDHTFDCSVISFIISQLSQNTGVNATFKANSQELYLVGTATQVRNSYNYLCRQDCFKEQHQYSLFSLEIATDQKEFVSGKKNGKLSKIMRSCKVMIRFTNANDYNSCIVLEGSNSQCVLDGLDKLQDELPAEASYYVPEIHHRRIIGVAGKTIQRIMKQYGVYVKFSGADEYSSLGGYFENEHNVIARTPMKNRTNLDNLWLSVTEYITNPKDKDYRSTTLLIPYYLHRTLSAAHRVQLRDLCRMNNVKIWWPERLGSNKVTLYGPQVQIPIVKAAVEQIVMIESHVSVILPDGHPEKENILTGSEFTLFLEQRLRSLHNELSLIQAVVVNSTPLQKEEGEQQQQQQLLQWDSMYHEKTLVFRLSHTNAFCQTHSLNEVRNMIQSVFLSNGWSFLKVTKAKEFDIALDHLPPTIKVDHSLYEDDDELRFDGPFVNHYDSLPNTPISPALSMYPRTCAPSLLSKMKYIWTQ